MKIIPNGTEVIIPYKEDEEYITGVIESSEMSDDLSYHGSAYYEQIYKVFGDNGKIFVCTHGMGVACNCYFRTKEEHISFLKCKITQNEQKIKELEEKNNNYLNKIKELEGNLEQQNQKELILTKKLKI